MGKIVPARFLVRVCHPCPYVKEMPQEGDELFELPESARLQNFAGLDGSPGFADVRLAWNEFGLGVQCEVRGKTEPPQGEIDRPRQSDGLALWLDTRDSRASHRASRYCHHFYFLAAGGGSDRSEPAFVQAKINRAQQDAPFANAADVLYRLQRSRGGYRLQAFLPAAALYGFDPEQHPRLGVYYALRDQSLGDQFLAVGWDFPFPEDPSLWEVLELVK